MRRPGQKTAFLALAAAAACGGGTEREAVDPPDPPPARAPTLDELRGLTIAGIFAEPVTLASGLYEGEPLVEGGAARPRLQLLESSVRLGDLDADGIDDAAVLLAESTGGSGVITHVAVARTEGGGIETVGTAAIGDRVVIRSMEILDGAVVLNVVAGGPGDPECCPTQKGVRTWRIVDDTLAGATEVADSVSAADLDGSEWRLRAIDGAAVPEEVTITAAFAGGTVAGSAGCNTYTATVRESRGLEIAFAPPVATLQACAGPAGEWERRYLDAIRTTDRFTWLLDDLVLTFRTPDGAVGTLRFEPS